MIKENKPAEGEACYFQIITVIGSSSESWEKAAAAVEQASKTLKVAATEGV